MPSPVAGVAIFTPRKILSCTLPARRTVADPAGAAGPIRPGCRYFAPINWQLCFRIEERTAPFLVRDKADIDSDA